jgi:hypothetical protein|tara:strand:- start:7292 stop:7618 length:327 start_codon:yes stop_codon:yes gene_type:complete
MSEQMQCLTKSLLKKLNNEAISNEYPHTLQRKFVEQLPEHNKDGTVTQYPVTSGLVQGNLVRIQVVAGAVYVDPEGNITHDLSPVMLTVSVADYKKIPTLEVADLESA